MLTCPNDGSTLTALEIESVPVSQCPTCGGHWLQRYELERLGEKHDAHLPPIVVGQIGIVDSLRKCPEDGTRAVLASIARRVRVQT